MAFTADEKISICKIRGITPTLLDAHLTSLGDDLTSEKEDAVRDEITRWNGGIANGFSAFTPTESNQGFNLDSNDPKNDVRRNIGIILEMGGGNYSSGMGTICLET